MTKKTLLTIFILLFSVNSYAIIDVDCGYERHYSNVSNLQYWLNNQITFTTTSLFTGNMKVRTTLDHCEVDQY